MGRTNVRDLVRRYFEDGVERRDLSVLPEILHPDYTFHGGGHTVTGRDRYLPMVKGFLDEHPDVTVSVHDVICTPTHVGVHLTKMTRSPRAAWKTVLIYRGSEVGALLECWYEQDWAGFRRQVQGIDPPAVVPPPSRSWQAGVGQANPAVEEAALRWIESSPSEHHPNGSVRLAAESVTVNCLFSAGQRFGFHATKHAIYDGGIDSCDSQIGAPAELAVAGMGTVRDGEVDEVCMVADLDMVRRQLRAGARR